MKNHPPPRLLFDPKSSPKKGKKKPERNVKAVALFTVSAAYGFIALAMLDLQEKDTTPFSMLALYLYGLVGGLGVLLMRNVYTEVDQNRKILVEVLEKSAEARIITGPDGGTTYSNVRFQKMVGREDDVSLRAFTALFEEPEKTQKALDDMRIKASPAGSATAEFQTRIKGRPHWFQVTCQHIIGWQDYIHWRFDDITPRYLMEATLHEEREKLRDFTDNAPVGFFSVNEDGKFIFANDTLLKLLGADQKTLIGKARLHDFLFTPNPSLAPYDLFEGGGLHQHGEILMRGAGSRIFKAAVTHSIAKTPEGDVITRSIVYDLTAEQKMQEALKESEDRFQRLFEEAPIGICMLAPDGTIRDANQALSGMLGLPLNVVNGKPLLNYISKESRRRAEDWLSALSKGEKHETFIEVRMKGASDIVAQIYARKFKSSDSFVIHFVDLTEQKNLERQFTQSQKMQAVGQLAGGIAHDFNNLLTAMIGFCDLLLLRHKPGDPSFADIMQVKQNANRAANLVRQLLAFSRQQTLQPKILDVSELLTELSHLVRRLIGANIDLQISHGADLGLIRADLGQMEQVLINLAVNARDAMPGGGKLSIRTENIVTKREKTLASDEILPPGEWISIAVEDTGTGIAPDVLPRIFEPFFSTKEVGAGTGLGLATVHGIVHQTGGFISVQSEVSKGTTFTLYLPRHYQNADDKQRQEAAEGKTAPSDLTGSSHILLVEDEDAVRAFSARALANKGYQVADAASAQAALDLLQSGKVKPEVLITDVMMPEMDGTTLAKVVREKYPEVKIIFISGYAEDKFKEHLGANVYFLPKPFTLKQLAAKVKDVITGES